MQTKEAGPALKSIYWGSVRLADSGFVMAATDEGLVYLQFHEGAAEEGAVSEEAWRDLFTWGQRHFPNYQWIQDQAMLAPYTQQLEEYLQGMRETFTLPVALRGTAFQQAVWRELYRIPHGRTASYTEIARQLDKASAVRAVGTAIGANPVLIVVPCHRVVGKNGALTGYRGGVANKDRLLRLEKGGVYSADRG
ncbi:methylated-DNA--[protein]-cysteine S-methyltransferase [Paenibacillus sp. GCM10023248]|uniref:methylated-DNA--[protein]-cysteine S-methyltransferase n=1 Tax=unclassified Paenibacillus TaxID=185978 RepID=UPI00237919B2|nr:methylated-DNA--[protein]-cysteine S-methyltransferase [Paenibacillus sp. MAHUQ-63]MDD9266933.1 methylated-DNA--[protein]-cysteine S-methyltransferase [Paenibacillus sp. MAHUQ-63]